MGQVECPRNAWNAMGTGDNSQSDKKYKKKPTDFDTFLPNTTADCYFPPRRYLQDLNSPGKNRKDECLKTPSLGVDCLIQTLKETQEFVDSWGQVPGLAGLGLMDPSESPYFKPYSTYNNESKKKERVSHEVHKRSFNTEKPLCQNSSSLHDKLTPALPNLKSFTTSYNPLSSRMSRPSMITYENEENEPGNDANKIAPCGESKCKSKRKVIKKDTVSNLSVLSKSSRSKERKNLRATKSGRSRYVYLTGNEYSGIGNSHRKCNNLRKRVPAHMGWLWNHQSPMGRLKPRAGWKPGAISRHMREIIRDTKAVMTEKGGKTKLELSRGKSIGTFRTKSNKSLKKIQMRRMEKSEEYIEPPPTLHVLRKDGTYYVTMYPIKDETMDVPKLEEPTKPLQFKIVKNKDDDSIISSSLASDMEIEFSPPAAVNRYKKKPNVVHVSEQARQQDILDAFKPTVKPTERKDKKEKKKKK